MAEPGSWDDSSWTWRAAARVRACRAGRKGNGLFGGAESGHVVVVREAGLDQIVDSLHPDRPILGDQPGDMLTDRLADPLKDRGILAEQQHVRGKARLHVECRLLGMIAVGVTIVVVIK